MALDPSLVQKVQQMATCSPEDLASKLEELVATGDSDTWRRAINLIVLTMWMKHEHTSKIAKNAFGGVKVFKKMLEGLAGQATQEPTAAPPGMPGRPAAPQPAGGPMTGGPTVDASGRRFASDGTEITDPAQLAAEAALDAAFGAAPAPQVPSAPGPAIGTIPPRPRNGGGKDYSIGPDGQPRSAEQQEMERILDEATGQG